MTVDKNWAQSYLIDPLTAPDPSDETGPGSHFRSTFAPASSPAPTPPHSAGLRGKPEPVAVKGNLTGSSSSTNPFRRNNGASYPTPPNSVSPRKEKFPSSHRQEAFAAYNNDGESNGRPRRSSSLKARFPGDDSHRLLDIIRRDSKKAYRAPHLRKKHMPGADLIDRLDIYTYHHEGPYDAVLMARNTSFDTSPVAALTESNAEALKATPLENIQDSLLHHRPLDGTAVVAPGIPDRLGRVYDYEEGTDMMRDLGGNYKRWQGINYLPDDLKGKGEPSYTIDKSLREHKASRGEGIELKTRSRNKSLSHADPEGAVFLANGSDYVGVKRSNTTGKKVSEGLRKTFGSFRRKRHD